MSLRIYGFGREDHKHLVTFMLCNGSPIMRKAIFRKFVTLLENDGTMEKLSDKVRHWLRRAAIMMKRKKGKNADDVINDELANDPLNPFIRMSHRYSHSALELFFYNKEIYELFKKKLPELIKSTYETCINRRKSKPRPSKKEVANAPLDRVSKNHLSSTPKKSLDAPEEELPIGEFNMSELNDVEVQYYYQREIYLLVEIGGLVQRFGTEEKRRALEQAMRGE